MAEEQGSQKFVELFWFNIFIIYHLLFFTYALSRSNGGLKTIRNNSDFKITVKNSRDFQTAGVAEISKLSRVTEIFKPSRVVEVSYR